MSEDLVKIKLSEAGGIHGGSRWKKMGAFGKFVDDGEDGIVSTGSRGKVSDEVHGNAVPTFVRDVQRVQKAHGSLVARFRALACGTGTYVGLDVVDKAGPKEGGGDGLEGLTNAKVAVDDGVVVFT